jgi:hypothetical protein
MSFDAALSTTCHGLLSMLKNSWGSADCLTEMFNQLPKNFCPFSETNKVEVTFFAPRHKNQLDLNQARADGMLQVLHYLSVRQGMCCPRILKL